MSSFPRIRNQETWTIVARIKNNIDNIFISLKCLILILLGMLAYKVSSVNIILAVAYFLFYFIFEQFHVYRKKMSGKYRVPIKPSISTNFPYFKHLRLAWDMC